MASKNVIEFKRMSILLDDLACGCVSVMPKNELLIVTNYLIIPFIPINEIIRAAGTLGKLYLVIPVISPVLSD